MQMRLSKVKTYIRIGSPLQYRQLFSANL